MFFIYYKYYSIANLWVTFKWPCDFERSFQGSRLKAQVQDHIGLWPLYMKLVVRASQFHMNLKYCMALSFVWLIDDQMLVTMLRGAKWSQLRAREMIENSISVRMEAPEWFCTIDPCHPKNDDLLNKGWVLYAYMDNFIIIFFNMVRALRQKKSSRWFFSRPCGRLPSEHWVFKSL